MKPDVEQNLLKAKTLFEAKPQLYAHVIQFGISHGVLTLAVHEGNFLQRVQFVCGGCYHFCGDLEGGPYKLEIFATPNELPELTVITIRSTDSTFLLKCTQLSEPRSWRDNLKAANKFVIESK